MTIFTAIKYKYLLGSLPSLLIALGWMFDLAQERQYFLLQRISPARVRIRCRAQLQIDIVIGQKLCDGHFVKAKAYLGLFTKQTKTRHGRLHGVHVNAPQVDKEDDLQF